MSGLEWPQCTSRGGTDEGYSWFVRSCMAAFPQPSQTWPADARTLLVSPPGDYQVLRPLRPHGPAWLKNAIPIALFVLLVAAAAARVLLERLPADTPLV